MRVLTITGPDDPRVARYADIGDHERLRAHGLFVAEGRLVVERLLERVLSGDSRIRVHSLLLNSAAFRALESTLSGLAGTVDVFVCDTDDFTTLTGFNIHRGCLALAERPPMSSADALLPAAKTVVALERVADADNVGSVFRNAAAFGVGAILLSHGCADPLYRKAVRTSMAATLRVPFSTVPADGWHAALAALRTRGFQLVALTPGAAAEDLDSFACAAGRDRIALLLGAESTGLSPETESIADALVRIAIRPDVDSLNVAVAAGIALHRLVPRPSA